MPSTPKTRTAPTVSAAKNPDTRLSRVQINHRANPPLLFTTKNAKTSALSVLDAHIVIEIRKRTFKYRKHHWSALAGKKFPITKLARHVEDAKVCIFEHLHRPHLAAASAKVDLIVENARAKAVKLLAETETYRREAFPQNFPKTKTKAKA